MKSDELDRLNKLTYLIFGGYSRTGDRQGRIQLIFPLLGNL